MSAASRGDNPLSPCPVGFIPPECIHECHDGHYGVNCLSLCSASCLNMSCRPQNGDCYRCQVGFFGPMCAEKCRPGSHGVNCSMACPVNCRDRRCDPFSGYCLDCIDGYGGSKCEDVKRLQGFPSPARQVSPAEKNDHTVLYISIIVVTVTLPVCTVSLWACILKKKFKEMYYRRFMERAASFSPIYYRDPKDNPFLESNYGDSKNALKTEKKPLRAKRTASPLGSPSKRPRKHAPRQRSKNEPRKPAGAGGESLGAQVVSPGVNQDDYKQTLKKNNSITVSQAANYSQELFFTTPNPVLKPAQESSGVNDHPPEISGANRPAQNAKPWSLVPAGDNPVSGDHKNKAILADVGCGLKDPAIDATQNVSAGNHVAQQMIQVYQLDVTGNQQNATERASPYSGISTTVLKATASYEKGTNVCDADLAQHVTRPQKRWKLRLNELRKMFSRVASLGWWKARGDNKPAMHSLARSPALTQLLPINPSAQGKVVQKSVANGNLRNAHKAYSCPVIVGQDPINHQPTPLAQVTHSVPVIKQPPVSEDVSQSNKPPRRSKFSRRFTEVPDCNVNFVSQSEAVTKTTVRSLVPWNNDGVKTYSQEHTYAGTLDPLECQCDVRQNGIRPLPIQESNSTDQICMPVENVGNSNNPPSPSITRWPVTSYFYSSRCIESAAGHPASHCQSPVICEMIDVINATVSTKVSEAASYNNKAAVSDDQLSSTYVSLRDSTKNSTQHSIPDVFSSNVYTNMHRLQGNETADDQLHVEDNDIVFVNVGALGAQARCQKRSTQTRLTGVKHPAHTDRVGANVQRKNVRTRMSTMISREEVSPVLYRSPCHSPGLVLNKTESYTKCTPAGLVQLTDQRVRFMNVTPMPKSRSAMRCRESSKERAAAQRRQENEQYVYNHTGKDTFHQNHPHSKSIPSGDAQKVPDREMFINPASPTDLMSSPDFSGILKEANRRGKDALHGVSLKRSENKPPKGFTQRTDKVNRRNTENPLYQRPFVPSPDRKPSYTPSPSNMPLNISRNNAPAICCQESLKSPIVMQETLGDLTSLYNFHMKDAIPILTQADVNNTCKQTSPRKLSMGLESGFNRSISNNSLGGPTSPRDDSGSFQYLERRTNNFRDGRVQLHRANESVTRGDLSDNRVNVSEVTDPKETYAEAFSLHGCHDRRAQLSVPRECFPGFGGCDSDLFITNTNTFGRVSPCSLKCMGKVHSNQNNILAVNDTTNNRNRALLNQVDCEDLTHNAVNTCARLANYRQISVLHDNPHSPRLAIMGKGTRATGLKRSRKTRLSFPLYDVNSVDDQENPLVALCKKPSSELTSGQVLCRKSCLSPLVKINRVVISEPTNRDSSSSSDSTSSTNEESDTHSVRHEDKVTCVDGLQSDAPPRNMYSSLLPTNWQGAAMCNMLTEKGVYRTRDDSHLPTGALLVKHDDEKCMTQPRQNLHFVLKSPSLRKCPRRMRNGRVCRSESPCIATRYPMPSILEAVAQTDDNLFDGISRFALGDRLDDPPKPCAKETAEHIYTTMAECRSCPLFSQGSILPTSQYDAPRKALLVDHGVNTAFAHPTVDAGCQCATPIMNADKSCLAKKKSIIRSLRPEDRTEYRSIIEGDSDFFYDAMDYRDFESNTSKEQSDWTFTKSPSTEPTDKAVKNKKHRNRRFLLVDLMSRCHLSKLTPSSTPNHFAKPSSKLKQSSSINGGSSQGVHGNESHKNSATDERLSGPKKKFALILAPAAAKQAGNASAERRAKFGFNRSDCNSSKKSLKKGGGVSVKRPTSGLTILACSWPAEKGAHGTATQRAGDGSEGSSTWTASGGNLKPATRNKADRRHGIPPRSEVFFDAS